MLLHLVISFFMVFAAGAGLAQTAEQKPAEEPEAKKKFFYQWTDDRGVVHITDELGKVPQKYRGQATQLEVPKQEKAAEGRQGQQPPSVPAYSDALQQDEAKKAHWQQRMKYARQQLADAEQRYRQLEQQHKEALESAGSPATGRRQGRVDAERIEREMVRAQQEIDDARNRIEVGLPDEARKAGVPPGWLRE